MHSARRARLLLARPASISRARNLRRFSPHAAAKRLRFSFRSLQLGEPRQRHSCGHPSETFPDERRVDELAGFGHHVREAPVVDIRERRFLFEAYPSVQHETREAIARLTAERRRRIEAASNFRSVDAEKPDASVCRHVDRVTVENAADQDGIRTMDIGRRGN